MMTEPEGWQVSGNAAEVYEKCFVPAIFGQWRRMWQTPQGWPLQIVCSMSAMGRVLARAAADRVAAAGQVTGLDRNDGMLAVARRLQPQIDWRQGDDAIQLPFADGSYDVVMSQFALMYFPDRLAALKEMVRVLKPGGRLAIAVWGPYERATGYVILTEIVQRRCGQAAADILTAPFALGNKGMLLDLCKAAGINDTAVALREGTMTFPTN